MKKTSVLGIVKTAMAVMGCGLLITGCQKSEEKGAAASGGSGEKKAAATAPASSGPAITPAEKTSFQEVTSQLDPGGNLYVYLSTESFLRHVSDKVEDLHKVIANLPDVAAGNTAEMDKAFALLQRQVKNSGLEDISGVGVSSVAVDKDLYRTRFVVHHYPGGGQGSLWSTFGAAAHPLDSVNLLPADTAFAFFSDFDAPQVWDVINKEVAELDIPEATKNFATLPQMFEMQTGLKLDETLRSLGGEYGVALCLNPTKKFSFPVKEDMLKIPEPSLLLVIKVKNELIYSRVEKILADNPQVKVTDRDGLKMLTMPVPMPLPLRPSLARIGDYLVLGSTDTVVEEAFAVHAGKKPGLKGTPDFQKLRKDLPEQGNGFAYAGENLSAAISDLQQQAMASPNNRMSPEQTQWMQKFMGLNKVSYNLTIWGRTESGWKATSHGNQAVNMAALGPVIVAPVGLLAAIAIPNFVKARATAQKNTCIANLKQLDGAKEQWALENKKGEGAAVDFLDLVGPQLYIRKQPVCPKGGTYTLGAIGEAPTCTEPEHELP